MQSLCEHANASVMRLTKHTDYALRVLIHIACHPDRMVSTEEISEAFGISNHHLVKVVNHLGKLEFVSIKRGRNGGISIDRPLEDIRIGDVVAELETDFILVECFDAERNTCRIAPSCALIKPLKKALDAFVAELNRHTLADVVAPPKNEQYKQLLVLP